MVGLLFAAPCRAGNGGTYTAGVLAQLEVISAGGQQGPLA